MENKKKPVLCDNLTCTGCSACYNACPVDAIEMCRGIDGFEYPVINDVKCIGCFSCERSCPVLKPINISSFKKKPDVFACWNNEQEVRDKSSSGGAFSAIAQAIIEKNGSVVGAAFQNDMSVIHSIYDSKAGIEKLRGSKYVQSQIGDIFRKIKEQLQESRAVLFVGTPCQVAGLRSYLRKDYENLYCCDFICHGTPSPILFKNYITWINENKNIEVNAFNFRSKRSGWYDALRVANGNIIMKGKYDSYFYGFNHNITLRESCYRCPAIGLPRKGDITIADFWGVGMMYKFPNLNEIPKGISLVMINNEKGAELFEFSKPHLFYLPGNFEEALNRNKPMIKPSTRPKCRDTFYNDAATFSYEDLREKYFKRGLKSRFIAGFREYSPYLLTTSIRKLMQYISWKRNGSKTL